jgi:Tfp pilus assembly protein PilO
MSRRRLVARVLERVAVGLVLLALGLWLGVVRPFDDKLRAEQQAYRNARQQKLATEAQLSRLENIPITDADADLKDFVSEHMPARRRSFSKAADLVLHWAQESGVQLSGVSYRLGEGKHEPLQSLGIEVNVQGPFPGVMGFAHAVETSSDFLVLRSFNLEAGDGGTLTLRMAANLYLTP